VTTATKLAEWRSQFPVTDEWAYLNHAALGPLPQRTTQAINEIAAALASPIESAVVSYRDLESTARENVAALVKGKPAMVAFAGSLAESISLAACGIDWQPGDNVVIPRDEFPSVVYPFLNLARRGVEIRYVDKDADGFTSIDLIREAIDDRTRALALSHVEFMTGFQNDLSAIGTLCRERDILSIIDGTQSIGAQPIDILASGIDVIAAHAYKWLLSSFGLGVMHFSERAIERIHPTYAGRLSVKGDSEDTDYHLTFRDGAERYQTGGLNWITLAAFNASAGLVREADPAQSAAHTFELTERLLNGVEESGYRVTSSRERNHRSQIVSFTSGDRDTDARLVEELERRKVSVCLRGRGVRVSPYFYNTVEDIDRLLESLPPR